MQYFKNCHDPLGKEQRDGHYKFLTNKDTLLLLGLLCDVLDLVRRMQVKCQSDTVTLDELNRNVQNILTDLSDAATESITGGWEAEILKNLQEAGDATTFFGVPLWCKTRRPNRNVVVLRPYATVRPLVITQLKHFFTNRMKIDDSLLATLKPLTRPHQFYDTGSITACHRLIAPDMQFESSLLPIKTLLELKISKDSRFVIF